MADITVHIREVINSTDSKSIENLVQTLIERHSKYATQSTELLQRLVSESLKNPQIGVNITKPVAMSLNASLASNYRSNPSTSKRRIPEEFLKSPTNSDTSKAEGNAANNAATDGKTPSAEAVTPIKKIRKKVKLSTEPNSDPQKVNIDEAIVTRINSSNHLTPRPKLRLADLAGLDQIQKQIKELVFYPIQYPNIYRQLGVSPPCGVLLHGASGCGKTSLAFAIAGELNLPFFKASGPELIGGTSGESEERIRNIFEAAAEKAPSVLFIDALDVIAGKKDSTQRSMDRRVVAQLFDSIDYISGLGVKTEDDSDIVGETVDNQVETNEFKHVILIAATNRPDSIDPGVRGRFSKEITLPVPDAPARKKILDLMTKDLKLSSSVNFATLSKLTPGFVGSDLQALVREAGMLAVSRIVGKIGEMSAAEISTTVEDLQLIEEAAIEVVQDTSADLVDAKHENIEQNFVVEMDDFVTAAKSIQPTAKREGFAVAPDVTWSDIGALAEVREELLHNVLRPISNPNQFRNLGLEVPAGVLFFGPPGCGKTLLAKALANQSGANFISVKGPELLNMYVGESESRVRQVFSRARASAPCVIFFDELDALCPRRGSAGESSGSSSGGVSERVVNQFLTELDGVEVRKDVYIIAATNRLELIDEAMLRPGRLGKLLYVPLPTAEDRVSILRALTRKVSIDLKQESIDQIDSMDVTTSTNFELNVTIDLLNKNSAVSEDPVDILSLANDPRADGFSGADLGALVREAGLAVMREITENLPEQYEFMGANKEEEIDTKQVLSIKSRHFEAAFGRVRPSVSARDRKRYELVHSYIKSGLSALQALERASTRLIEESQ